MIDTYKLLYKIILHPLLMLQFGSTDHNEDFSEVLKGKVLMCSEQCENTTNTHNNTSQSTSSRGGGMNHLNQVERHVSLVIEDQLAGAHRNSG